jgi:hypothetical protein
MSINKKSLISNRIASKKAIVTKPEVTSAEPTKLIGNAPKVTGHMPKVTGHMPKVVVGN